MYYQRNYHTGANLMPPQKECCHGFSTYQKSSAGPNDNEKALAMAYVPWQTWGSLYSPDEALKNGTVFKDLDKKFCG
ncbi:MAG: spore coat associated protein CotJA [Clostridiales bacterium]|nr:spore coat associated protein CotJA [Clostridiales bacterium]